MNTAGGGQRRVLWEGIAVAWLLACGAGFLAPALSHGSAIGPYDLLHAIGVTSTPRHYVHNAVASDQIQQFIPWQVLDWVQVHAGRAPLWQPANLLGMPLAFNFQSAPFSLPVAVGYLFSVGLAHTVTIAVELVLAGTGAYVFCRTLGLEVLASAVGATIFELCGGFTIWLGVYEAGCCCMLGWILAASAILARGRRRAVPVVLLATGLALAFAAGEPQIDAFVVGTVGVVVLAAVVRGGAGPTGDGTTVRAWRIHVVVDHVLALVAACGLVAPIYLPGVQVLLRSARVHGPYASGLPPHDIVNLLFPWYSGVPTNLASVVGPDNLYVATVFVGGVGLALAAAGLSRLRRRPEVLAFGMAAVILVVLLYVPAVTAVMRHIPYAKFFRPDLGNTFLGFALAVLAAFGVEALVGSPSGRQDAPGPDPSSGPDAPRWAGRLFAAATAAMALVLLGLGLRLALSGGHLTAAQRNVRTAGFLWPAVSVGACAAFALCWHVAARMRSGAGGRHARSGPAGAMPVIAARLGVVALVFVQAAFCIVSGAWSLSSTSSPFRVTPSVAALQRVVGTSLVAMGTCPSLNTFPPLGIMPDANAAYGVNELTDYDPIMTIQYYRASAAVSGTPRTPPVTGNAVLCPPVTSAGLARFYGASFILDPAGARRPAGTRLVAEVHGEDVYAVPDSGRASLVPLGSGQAGAERPDQIVATAREAVGGTWRIVAHARRRSTLVVRVTSVPGWHATIDGRPLPLRTFGTVMLSATVPAGRHVITLRYWPSLWGAGLLTAAVTAAALLAVLGVAGYRRRRPAGTGTGVRRATTDRGMAGE